MATGKVEAGVGSDQIVDGFRVCEKVLRGLLEKDSPLVRERAVGLYDMPCPRGLKTLRDQVWKRLRAELGDQYVLLSTRIITNDAKSSDQLVHRDIDLCEKLPVLLVFMLPLVEVTAERGPTEIMCATGATLMTTKPGEIYGFDAYLKHRSMANKSNTCRHALVLDCCLRTHKTALKKDPLYRS